MIAVEIVSLYPPGPAGESDRARWTMHTEPGAATQPRHVEIGCPGCARPMRLDGYKIEPGGVVTPTFECKARCGFKAVICLRGWS